MHHTAPSKSTAASTTPPRLSHLRIVIAVEGALQLARDAAESASVTVELAHGPDSRKTVHEKNLIGLHHVAPFQSRDHARESRASGCLEHPLAGHASHSAAIQARRSE